MVIVLTHSDDMHEDPALRREVPRDCERGIKDAVGETMDVYPPIFVSGKTGEGVDMVVDKLKEIVESSLSSPELLRVIRRLLADNLMSTVRAWSLEREHCGLESVSSWARRTSFANARVYGARWDNFHEDATWEDVRRLNAFLGQWTRPAGAMSQSEEFHHLDNLRKFNRKIKETTSIGNDPELTPELTVLANVQVDLPEQ
jgi:hypothetical protein